MVKIGHISFRIFRLNDFAQITSPPLLGFLVSFLEVIRIGKNRISPICKNLNFDSGLKKIWWSNKIKKSISP